MLEAIVEHNVLVRVFNVHISGTNVHVWVLKNAGYNVIYCLFSKIGWTHTFDTRCMSCTGLVFLVSMMP